jgi:molecular chaperone GrpE
MNTESKPNDDNLTADKPVMEMENPPTESPKVEVENPPQEDINLKTKLAELTATLAATEKKAQDYWDSLARQKAEYENLQKRTERDIEQVRKFALEKFALELLPIRDNLELGIEAANKPGVQIETVVEGMQLTEKALMDTLNKFGIEEINPQEQKFNPEWHEAMAAQPVPDVANDTVIFVHRKGYHLNQRLLRAAQVIVAKNPDPT